MENNSSGGVLFFRTGDNMLKTRWQIEICKDYNSKDKNGKYKCHSCPYNLINVSTYGACLMNHHFDPKTDKWIPDKG